MFIMVVLIGLAIAQAVYYYPKLPDTVASHFGPSGQADGWMSKGAFLGVMVGVMLAVCPMLLAISVAMLSAAQRPKKKQDPANEAAEKTAQAQAINQQWTEYQARFMGWFSVATMGLLLTIFLMANQANLSPNPALPHAWTVLIIYVAILAGLGIRLVIQYAKWKTFLPPRAPLPPGVWFQAKRFGYGWGPPTCWQGWIVMIAWLAIFFSGTIWLIKSDRIDLTAVFWPAMIVLLIVILYTKGEKPRWRWGDED